MGVCIETVIRCDAIVRPRVTPYMGVCIETVRPLKIKLRGEVTPYMGVCIETALLWKSNCSI